MRIVIDLQGAQSESRTRGIGRYSLAFAQSIARNKADHEVLIALNAAFPDTIAEIEKSFRDLIPAENIRVWRAAGPLRAIDIDNAARRKRAEIVREHFLASLQPDIVHLSSLFEGFIDDSVTNIRGDHINTATLYDVIPLHNEDHFLSSNLVLKDWYYSKLECLKKADALFAISDFSAKDARVALNLKNDIVNVSTSISEKFVITKISDSRKEDIFRRIGLHGPFVLTSGTTEPHKNIAQLLKAYALLPVSLRESHQLVLIGKNEERQRFELDGMVRAAGLRQEDFIVTGHVTDDDLVALYNLCDLMVFPSYDEGFGLPALEAMACGAPTIGSRATSLPETIGLDEALFDPHEVKDMARLLELGLEDVSFRRMLKEHALSHVRKFSWDSVGKKAIEGMEALVERGKAQAVARPLPARQRRPKLAFISPLPPSQTGIAGYSLEIIPELQKYYDVTVIVEDDSIKKLYSDDFPIYGTRWFLDRHRDFDRIIYQFGNSPFHNYERPLAESIPGVVVLHDFFLSSLYAWLEWTGAEDGAWVRELYNAHGYWAVRDRFHDEHYAKTLYPCNLGALRSAHGVIVHSHYARSLADRWLSPRFAANWSVVNLARGLKKRPEKKDARRNLGIPDDSFVVCSFGIMDPAKLNDRLLDAFLASSLKDKGKCHLIFVGENNGAEYGKGIEEKIEKSGIRERIHITGWVDDEHFDEYLSCADVAVQLRTSSRGETSAAVLDCMAARLPTIINANGSLAEFPAGAVWMLDDRFADSDLIAALEGLYRSAKKRKTLGDTGHALVANEHSPQACAARYHEAIEAAYAKSPGGIDTLVDTLVRDGPKPEDAECLELARSISMTFPEPTPKKRLLLDVSATCVTELHTGIERTARALVRAFLEEAPEGFRVEPVYLCNEGGRWHYRFARNFTLGLLGVSTPFLGDEVVEPYPGDVLVGLDISGAPLMEAARTGLFREWRSLGGSVYFTVFDLLPIRMPQHFPAGSAGSHEQWLKAVLETDGAICISKAVADDLEKWIRVQPGKTGEFRIGWFHLGADFENAEPTRGLPPEAPAVLQELRVRPTFVMVGTIEPRKGHALMLDAFEELWREGVDLNLVIVGAAGWRHLPDGMRGRIPEIVRRLETHPERGRRLFWLNDVSDEYLDKLYSSSGCLVAASEGEGFGLPLIEAAKRDLPILAHDIPVFREVAGSHAYYYSGSEPGAVARQIKEWLDLFKKDEHPKSQGLSWVTWKDSAAQIGRTAIEGKWPTVYEWNEPCVMSELTQEQRGHSLELAAGPDVVDDGRAIQIVVSVTNLSDVIWSSRGGPDGSLAVNLGYHLLDREENLLQNENPRTAISLAHVPGDTLHMPVVVPADWKNRGAAFVEIELVQEGVAWFGNALRVSL